LAQRAAKKIIVVFAKHYAQQTSRAFYPRAHTRFAWRLGRRVMKKLLLGSVGFVARIVANAASAADMGLPVKGRMVEPAWNWSGFYAGLNAGYARGTSVSNDLDGTINAGGVLVNESTNGFIGGGQIGYNWQFRYAVFGLETYGRAEHTIVGNFVPNPHDLSATKIGPVAGIGLEYGLDPRWSIKTEALYVDLGKNSGLCCGDANSGFFTGRFDVNDTMWIVRAGANYKFGS
jgi:opacity protein-like surface antigen